MNAQAIIHYKKNIAVSQAVVEAKLKAESQTGEAVNIAKVLSINADSYIIGYEALDGEAVYNGRAALKVMYITDTGECGCMDYNADFTDKIVSEHIKPNSELRLYTNVIDTNASAPSLDIIKVSCVLETHAECVLRTEINSIAEAEDTMLRHEPISFNSHVFSGNQEFVVTNEVEVNEEIEKICMSEAVVILDSANPIMDSVMLKGKIYTNIVYIPSNGSLTTRSFETPFSEEVPLSNASAEMLIDYSAMLTKWQARAETFEGEKKTILKLEFKVLAEIDAFLKQEAVIATDAFSVGFDIQKTTETASINRLESIGMLDSKIEGTAELQEGMPAVDRVLAVCGSKINIANCYADTDRIVIEGVLNTAIIYHNKEFENHNSVAVEIPFSISTAYAGTAANDIIEVRPVITDINARANQFSASLTAQVTMQVLRSSLVDLNFISEITKGEPRTSELNAIAVYIIRPNQTLWDVAKALSTTEQALLEQNPEMTTPLKGGERVVLYRQL